MSNQIEKVTLLTSIITYMQKWNNLLDVGMFGTGIVQMVICLDVKEPRAWPHLCIQNYWQWKITT